MEIEEILTELDIIVDWFDIGDEAGRELAKNRLNQLIQERTLRTCHPALQRVAHRDRRSTYTSAAQKLWPSQRHLAREAQECLYFLLVLVLPQ